MTQDRVFSIIQRILIKIIKNSFYFLPFVICSVLNLQNNKIRFSFKSNNFNLFPQLNHN